MVTAVPCISCRGTHETPLTGIVGAQRTLNASFKLQMWSFSEDKYLEGHEQTIYLGRFGSQVEQKPSPNSRQPSEQPNRTSLHELP